MGGIVSSVSGPFLGGGDIPSQNSGILASIAQWVIDGAGGIFKSIRDKAKAKKALAIANAGGYNTLTAYQKSLILFNPAVSSDPKINYQDFPGATGFSNSSILLLVIVVIVALFFISKRKQAKYTDHESNY